MFRVEFPVVTKSEKTLPSLFKISNVMPEHGEFDEKWMLSSPSQTGEAASHLPVLSIQSQVNACALDAVRTASKNSSSTKIATRRIAAPSA